MRPTIKLFFGAAAALLLLHGCSGCKKKPGQAGKAGAKAVAFDALDLPGPILAYGGARSPRPLAQRVAGVASAAAPAGGSLPQALETGLPRALGLSSGTGLALDKPLRFLLLDAEDARGRAAILLVTVPSRKRFEETLPEGYRKDVDGNAYVVEGRSGRVYLNFLGDTLVATRAPGHFKAHRAAIEALAAATPPDALEVVVPVAKVRKAHEKRIASALDRMVKAGGEAGPQRELMAKLAAAARRAVQDTDRVVARLATPGGSVRLTVDARLAPGSKLAAAAPKLPAAKKLDLLARLPATTAAFAAMNIAPAPLADLLGDLIGKLFSMGIVKQVGLDAAYAEAAVKLLRASTGQAVQAVLPEGGGIALAGAFGVSDPAATREALATMLDAYGREAVQAAYAKQGVRVTVSKEAYRIGDVPVAKVDMAFTSLAGAPLGKMLSNLTSTHIAVADDLTVFAYGERGKAALARLVAGKPKESLAKTPGVAQALALAGQGAIFVLYASASDLAALLGPPGSPRPAKPNASPGITVALRAGAGALGLVADLPGEQVRAVGQLIQRVLMQLGGAFIRAR